MQTLQMEVLQHLANVFTDVWHAQSSICHFDMITCYRHDFLVFFQGSQLSVEMEAAYVNLPGNQLSSSYHNRSCFDSISACDAVTNKVVQQSICRRIWL